MKCSFLMLSVLGLIACDQEPLDDSTVTEDVVLGALDKSLIDDVVREGMPEIRSCYQSALAVDPDLEGKIVVKFVIAASGEVSRSEITDDEITDDEIGAEDVTDCILDHVDGFVFPPPVGNGIVIVRYPFLFTPG